MSKEERKEFIERMKYTHSDDIAEDFKRLVEKGTIEKIMKREGEFKKSGGYTELDQEK